MEKLIEIRPGVDFCYEEFGDDNHPTLLLIQGFTAQMIGWNPEFCKLLASHGFRVIIFDNRDIGRSAFFPGEKYSIADMADDTADLLNALNIADAHIVGQSMGGMIAQEFAIRHEAKTRSLALVYTAPNNSYIRESVNDRPDSLEGKDRDEAVEIHLESEQACGSRFYTQDVDFLRTVGGSAYDRNKSKDGVPRQRAAIDDSPDRSDALTSITSPTVIIAGVDDQLIDARASIHMHELIPDSSLALFAGMGHELPEALWPAITATLIANAERPSLVSAT